MPKRGLSIRNYYSATPDSAGVIRCSKFPLDYNELDGYEEAMWETSFESHLVMKEKANRTTIGYRLDNERLAKLETLAGKEGVTIHEKAKQMMIAALDERDAKEEMRDLALAEVQGKVGQVLERSEGLESGIKETFIALFQRLGTANESEARAFIEFVFGKEFQKREIGRVPMTQ